MPETSAPAPQPNQFIREMYAIIDEDDMTSSQLSSNGTIIIADDFHPSLENAVRELNELHDTNIRWRVFRLEATDLWVGPPPTAPQVIRSTALVEYLEQHEQGGE